MEIFSMQDFDSAAASNRAALFYFSTPDCNVCKVLRPKVEELISEQFPLVKFIYINILDAKELAAQKNIFTVPTILFYFEGKEYLRKSRFVNLDELEDELSRYYRFLE
ncbi:MAG: thioredoxin family protein [Melioribacteraceae bacterium]|nr:thioredoxin family protein [Melioribacteraceae bacterium]